MPLFKGERGLYEPWPRIPESNVLKDLGVWISPEICSAEEKIIGHGHNTLLVHLSSEHFPPWLEHITYEEALPSLPVAIRSRAAQLGVDCPLVTCVGIEGERIRAEMNLRVYGQRPLIIHSGHEIGCFFQASPKRLLTDEALVGSIGNRISLDGTYGKDWILIGPDYNPIPLDSNQAIGLGLRLEPERYYPEKGEPVDILGKLPLGYQSYREFLDNEVLIEIPENDQPPFWVTQTACSMYIPPGYTGILNPHVRTITADGDDIFPEHVRSTLIKGGETNWPIRIEIISPPLIEKDQTLPDFASYREMWALIHFFSSKHPTF